MPLTRLGLQVAPADSNDGLTKAMYDVLEVSLFKYLISFVIKGKKMFDFVIQVSVCF